MLGLPLNVPMFLATEPTDLRKGVEGLSGLVRSEFSAPWAACVSSAETEQSAVSLPGPCFPVAFSVSRSEPVVRPSAREPG